MPNKSNFPTFLAKIYSDWTQNKMVNGEREFPPVILKKLNGFSLELIIEGLSGALVYRMRKTGEQNRFLKFGKGVVGEEIIEEQKRLSWLQGKILVPKVYFAGWIEDTAYLITAEISGKPLSVLTETVPPEILVEGLAEGLHILHKIPIADCPFDMTLSNRIKEAKIRMEANLVDETDLDLHRIGRPLDELFSELLETKPLEEDKVFTHGDYCFPNILLKNSRISGFIDLGQAGIADRYQDIALALRSLTHNLGQQWQSYFLDAYGNTNPDSSRIEFYKLLDEFF